MLSIIFSAIALIFAGTNFNRLRDLRGTVEKKFLKDESEKKDQLIVNNGHNSKLNSCNDKIVYLESQIFLLEEKVNTNLEAIQFQSKAKKPSRAKKG